MIKQYINLKTNIMKKLLTLIFSLMFISLSAQVEYLYDFNSLQTGTKCLNGQDSWVTHYQTASTSPDFDVDYVCGDLTTPDETIGIFYPYGGPGIGRTATRKATPNFNFNFQDGGIMDLEMDMTDVWWGAYFGVGYDGNGDGHILVGMTDEDGGIFIRNAGSGNNYHPNLVLPDGTSIPIPSFTQSGWARYKMSFDFNAYNGQGSVTVFVKPGCEGQWLQLSEVTEVNMGLTPGSGDKFDYGVWDGLFFHCQGGTGGFDNLLVRQMPQGNVQYISMDEIPKQLITNPPITLQATATSGLPVSFELISGPATIDGNILTLTGEVGTVNIKAMQGGDATWLPAPDVYKTFDVIDPLAYTPEVKIRRPYNDTKVYMPELNPTMIVVSAYIEHSDALKIEKVMCNVDGKDLEAFTHYPDDPTNGYFSVLWTPSDFGNYTLNVDVTTTGGKVTSAVSSFEVTKNYETMDVLTICGDLICSPGVTSAKGEYVIPSHVGAFNKITAFYDHNCVNGNCDTYDRVGGINIRNYRGEWMELFRYISPFGVQCEDNIDVSDYTSLLQGLVELEFYFITWNGSGYNPNLTFTFEKGNPEYKYIDITEVWNETYPFGDYANQSPIPPVDFKFSPEAQKAKLKLTSTGHNWSSNTAPNYSYNTGNAAEFYEATHNILIDGTLKFTQHLWPQSGSCSPNPAGCQPQNGTWTFPRAGWCPGSIAMVWDYDLTDQLSKNSININYQFDPDYLDLCHPNHPDCIDGQTCTKCDAPDNPIIQVAGKVLSYSNNSNIFTDIDEPFVPFKSSFYVDISPNPASNSVLLSSNYNKGKLSVHILNMNGKEVDRFVFNNSKILDVSNYPKGTYIVYIIGDTMISKKLIIM
jgi:hypothetical protein